LRNHGTTLVGVAVIAAAAVAPQRRATLRCRGSGEGEVSLQQNRSERNSGNNGPTATVAKENPIPTAQAPAISDTGAAESAVSQRGRDETKPLEKGLTSIRTFREVHGSPDTGRREGEVIAKLQAAEDTPSKSGEGKGQGDRLEA